MKVLVLLATYNGEEYLEEQLNSLINQEGVEIHILVRDDGSSDKTTSILDCFKSNYPLDWYGGEHLNVQKGYLDLMRKAKKYDSDYFAFCDQDDVWDNDKLVIASKKIQELSTIKPCLYYSGQRLVDKDLNLIANHRLNEKRNLQSRFVLSDIAGCTAVFNRSLLNKVIRCNPDYILMHDTWLLKVCLSLGGEAIVDSESHMSYRQHGNNTVGLGRGLKSQLRQVKQYLNEYHVEQQMKELRKYYYEEMTDEYKKLTDLVCYYRTNFSYKKRLLDSSYINFYNKGLNITYFLKVVLNRL